MTLKLILAFVIAFAVSAVVGFFLVPYLKRIKAGQSIKENGPTWHMSKQGTPTMGGLMFIAAIAVVCLSVGFDCMAEGEYGHLFCLAFALVFGAIGFLDDYEKLKKKQNLGLTAGKRSCCSWRRPWRSFSSCAALAMSRSTVSTSRSGTRPWPSPSRCM